MNTQPYGLAPVNVDWKLAILSLSNYAKRLVKAERTGRLWVRDPVYFANGGRRDL